MLYKFSGIKLVDAIMVIVLFIFPRKLGSTFHADYSETVCIKF